MWSAFVSHLLASQLYQSKQPPPVPEDIVLSEEADNFRRKCFAMYVFGYPLLWTPF
jgi:hypothetical protein